MVRVSKEVLQKAAKTLSDILVCPLSKQPLRSPLSILSSLFFTAKNNFGVCSLNLNHLSFVFRCFDFHFQLPIDNCPVPFYPLGISRFLIKNGIPCLVPRDGKVLEEEDASKPDHDINLSAVNEENRGRSA
ncbi:hypothetical protein GmHk_01G002229 [Glycine max]|nr:hypothetical protein GmHk_01G002229 [Glycine max]